MQRPATRSDYLRAAADGLHEGNSAQAVQALAGAVAHGSSAEADELFEAVLQRFGAAAYLDAVRGEQPFYGNAALAGRALIRGGDDRGGLRLLLEVALAAPASQLLSWADEASLSTLTDERDLAQIGPLLARLARLEPRDPNDLGTLRAGAALASRLADVFTAQQALQVVATELSRASGQLSEAERIATRLYHEAPSALAAAGLARVRKDLGDLERAIALLREAYQLDPRRPEALIDIGDLLLSAERYQEATEAYNLALSLASSDSWITSSLLWVAAANGDAAADASLRKLARAGDPRAQDYAAWRATQHGSG